VNAYLEGATTLGSFAVALFFLRYWRDTSDRLFAVFAAAFALFGINRVALQVLDESSEARTWAYALRALTFLMIIAAVVDGKEERHDHDDREPDDP
jgi:uncharacterized membrane protein HdeD (DUF308 family)